jgi:hypothetical protein
LTVEVAAMMRTVVFGLIGAAVAGITLSAHHSFSAYYYEQQSVTIEGGVVEFDYRAPHAWVHVNALDASGQMRTYAAEWANPARLNRDNITKDTLRPGDVVRITGSPGREASEYKVHLKFIERPKDGWSWRGRQRGR